MKRDTRAPLIVAIVLLLLPVLYVGSYLALVKSSGVFFDPVEPDPAIALKEGDPPRVFVGYYRTGGTAAARFFWPLEQIDRKVRPEAWLEYSWLGQTLPSPRYFRDDIVSFAEGAEIESVLPGVPKIVHLLNWHHVKKEDLAASTGLLGDELDHEYEKAMETVAGVHVSLLLILADESEVYIEGLTDENQNLVAAELHSLAAYHTLLRREGGEDPDHELTLLRLGAAAELLLDGKPITLLPAEAAEHEVARGDKLGDAANKARELAIVKRIVARGKSAPLVLGGGHDLTEAIRPTGWGYVRVTPKGYPE